MRRAIITITDNGTVTVPQNVRMTVCEIADLFGIYYQTAKREIRAIEKSGIANGYYSMACVTEGNMISPEYYGLEIIAALAFRVKSAKTEMFRSWIIRKAIKQELIAMPILLTQNALLN